MVQPSTSDLLHPLHCRRQPGLPLLMRLGHTEVGDAPVVIPLPHQRCLWLDTGAADGSAALAQAEEWALQLLLQAPATHLEVYAHDTGLDTSLPALERMAAAAKSKGLPQRVHFITDAASLQTQLELWQSDARQRKSHLLQTSHAHWPALLAQDAGQPLRLVLLTSLEDLMGASARGADLSSLVQHGPKFGYWFWLLGPAGMPRSLRTAQERAQWQEWFDQRLKPHFWRLQLAGGCIRPPPEWAHDPALTLYQEFGALRSDGLSAQQREAAVARSFQDAADGAKTDAQDVWSAPIGQFQGQPYWFRIGPRSGCLHTMLAGTTDTGKTSFLNLLILRTCETVAPDEVQFLLFDLKQGVSFGLFEGLPHVARLHLHGGEYGPVLQALRDLMAERNNRAASFRAAADSGLVPDIAAYNRLARQRGTPTLPVLAVVIDEAQKLFAEGDLAQRREASRLVEEVAREGRAYGFTLLLSSQTYRGVDLPTAAASQFKLRMAFKLASEADCRSVLSNDNDAPLRLPKSHLVANDDFGNRAANRTVLIDYVAPEGIHHRLQAVRERYKGYQAPMLAVATEPTPQASPQVPAAYAPGRYTQPR